jgi:hypothetical protein
MVQVVGDKLIVTSEQFFDGLQSDSSPTQSFTLSEFEDRRPSDFLTDPDEPPPPNHLARYLLLPSSLTSSQKKSTAKQVAESLLNGRILWNIAWAVEDDIVLAMKYADAWSWDVTHNKTEANLKAGSGCCYPFPLHPPFPIM